MRPRSSAPALAPLLLSLCVSCSGATTPRAAPHPVPVTSQAARARDPEPQLPPPEATPAARLPDDVTPTRYALALEVAPERERYSGEAAIDVTLTRDRGTLWLHAVDLHVTEAWVETAGHARVEATFETESNGFAAVRAARVLHAGAVTVHLRWDAAFNPGLIGAFRVESGGQHYALTKFEPVAARAAFPCFDEPRFKTPYELTLTVPAGMTAIGNSHIESESDAPNGMHRVRFAPTRPLSTYLVAWAVGPWDVVETTLPPSGPRTRPLTVRGVAARGHGPQLAYALRLARDFVETEERYFNEEYPFDKLDLIAAPDYPSGAMENAGAIMFRESNLLLDDATAPEQQRRDLGITLAHELAHQWFGNMVTMAWWDDLWLNEAFAEWLGQRVVHERFPAWHADVDLLHDVQGVMSSDSLVSARPILQTIESADGIRDAFDWLTYLKGAAVLGMFERFLGAEHFQHGVRAHLARHRWGSATTDDLLSALSESAGHDVSAPFRSMLSHTGVPYVEARVECPANAPARIALHQSRFLPVGSSASRVQTWTLPVCARVGVGSDALEACTTLTEADGAIAVPTGACPAWAIPNADAAGYYRWSLPAADLAHLRERGAHALSARERLSIADSVRAAFDAATLPGRDVLASLAPFVTDTNRFVATMPMDVLRFVRNYVADTALRPRVEAHARTLYAPLYRRLGVAPAATVAGHAPEDGEAALLRREVVTFLADVGRDPALRRELAARGRRYVGLGGDGALHTDAIASDLAGIALIVAVQDGDAHVFDALAARLHATEDAVVRAVLIRALGATTNAALGERARALLLAADVRPSEMYGALDAMMSRAETRDATWTWLRAHLADVLARLPAQHAPYSPTWVASFCDAAHREEARALFAPRIAAIAGAPRSLATSLERVNLCTARVASQQEAARQFFRARR